jgi:hypothetical protein
MTLASDSFPDLVMQRSWELLLQYLVMITRDAAASKSIIPVAVATWKFGMLAVDAAAPLLAAGMLNTTHCIK